MQRVLLRCVLRLVIINKNKDIRKMKSTPRQVKEAKKTYERVVDHLVTEGYAKNKSDADNIIGGMSEEWYNMIINN